MSRIDITLGSEGLSRLREMLSNEQKTLRTAVYGIETRLGAIGKAEMQQRLPFVSKDGNAVGEVNVERDADGVRVSHSGEQVAYLEFGTGIEGQRSPYPFEDTEVGSGQWKYDVNGHGTAGWRYRNKFAAPDKKGRQIRWSKGIVGFAPVYHAYMEANLNLMRVAREVFGGKST